MLVQCRRSGVTVKREVAPDRTPATWGGSTVGQGAATEGLRGVGAHGADISPKSALRAWVKLRHSNDLSWVQELRARRCQRCGH